ncbi:uncharacterized protein LOC135827432 [Sycon ciliatum]|uniref:uncharacterized protein LOC135827432 n=1 Tax=Sycon ciliatum TaxID=27933 RepID=UPI0031F6C7A7
MNKHALLLLLLCAATFGYSPAAATGRCSFSKGISQCVGYSSVPENANANTKTILFRYGFLTIGAGAFGYLKKLKIITFSCAVKFTQEGFAGANSVTKLVAKGTINEFPSGALARLPALEKMSLEGAGLRTLSTYHFSGLSKLEKLTITSNRIATLENRLFSYAINLKAVTLNSNRIKEIKPYAFQGLSHLTHMELKHNLISSLDAATFAGLSSIQYIDLEQNALATILPGTFDNLPELETALLQSNDLNRNNRLCSIASLIKNEKISVGKGLNDFIKQNKIGSCNAPCTSVSSRLVCPGGAGSCSGTVGNPVCSDVDECSDGTHMCTKNGKCVNTASGYSCECERHFYGDTCTYWYGGDYEKLHRDQCDSNEFFVALPQFAIYHEVATLQDALHACQSFGLSLPTRRAQHCFYDTGFRLMFNDHHKTHRTKSLFFFADELEKYATKLVNGADEMHNVATKQAQFLCFAEWSQLNTIARECDDTVFYVPYAGHHPMNNTVQWSEANTQCGGKLIERADFSKGNCLRHFVKSANQMFGVKSYKVWSQKADHSIGYLGDYESLVQEVASVRLLPLCKNKKPQRMHHH